MSGEHKKIDTLSKSPGIGQKMPPGLIKKNKKH